LASIAICNFWLPLPSQCFGEHWWKSCFSERRLVKIFRDVEIFRNTFPEEQFFVKESKESFELFYLQHEIFKFKKIIQKSCIEAALVFLQ